jgi:hypothetical protein
MHDQDTCKLRKRKPHVTRGKEGGGRERGNEESQGKLTEGGGYMCVM